MTVTADRILDALAIRPDLGFEVYRKLRHMKYAGPWKRSGSGSLYRVDLDLSIVASVVPEPGGGQFTWEVFTGPDGMSVRSTDATEAEGQSHCDLHLRGAGWEIIDDSALWDGTSDHEGWKRASTGKWVRVVANKIVARVEHCPDNNEHEPWWWMTDEVEEWEATSSLAFATADAELKRAGVIT